MVFRSLLGGLSITRPLSRRERTTTRQRHQSTGQQLAYGWGGCLTNELGLGGAANKIERPRELWWEEDDQDGFDGVRFSAVGCGNGFSLFGVEGGGLYSCGSGALGQTGQENWKEELSLEQGICRASANQSIHVHEIDRIQCGSNHALMRTADDRQLWSMGAGIDGQLGNLLSSSSLSKSVPSFRALALPVLDGAAVSSFCAGWLHSLAVVAKDGAVYSWGRSHYCQLGHGDDLHSRRPKRIEALRKHEVRLVAAGSFHSMAVVDEGRELLVWGGNHNKCLLGMLPVSIDEPAEQARFLDTLPRVVMRPTAIHFGEQLNSDECIVGVAGSSTHSALWTSHGRLFCWGSNESGQLGTCDDRLRARPTLVPLPPDTIVTSVALGDQHTLALTSTGQIYAWGMGTDGQLGYAGALVTNTQPSLVTLPEQASKACLVAAGHRHSVAILSKTFC